MEFEPRYKESSIDNLFRAILSLKSIDECYRFFNDLCTVGEIKAMAQRFETAKLLYMGKTYDEITARTGMSTATISRIKRFLNYGADGYRLALERLGVKPEIKAQTPEGLARSHPKSDIEM